MLNKPFLFTSKTFCTCLARCRTPVETNGVYQKSNDMVMMTTVRMLTFMIIESVMYVYIYIYMHIYICVYVCTYIYIYVYIYLVSWLIKIDG